MSEWKEMNIAHKQIRDDLAIEPVVRLGKKPEKYKPWAVCYIHNWGRNRTYRDVYAKEADARQNLTKKQRNSWFTEVWLEFEGKRV